MHLFTTRRADPDQDARLDAAQKDLDRLTTWFANIETRSYVALTAQTIVVAIAVFIVAPAFPLFLGDVGKIQSFRDAPDYTAAEVWQSVAAASIFFGVSAALIALWAILLLAKDSVGHPSTRHNFFLHEQVVPHYKKVACEPFLALWDHLRLRTSQDILWDVTQQLYEEALIIASKVERLRRCTVVIVAQLFFLVLFLWAVAQMGTIISHHAVPVRTRHK